MRFSDSERSDAILGRPIVINPLHKLPRKLTPVRTIMMSMMRPCFKLPSSTSAGSCDKLAEADVICSGVLKVGRGRDAEREFRGGVSGKSFLLLGTNSMTDMRSDILILQTVAAQNETGGKLGFRIF